MHLTKLDHKKIRELKTKNNKIIFGKNYIILNKNILNEKNKTKKSKKIKKKTNFNSDWRF